MRKRRQEEHTDHEKWAIPYADLLTLLLAFFVVMYSLSSINEGKYRVMAESITDAFKGSGKSAAALIPSPSPDHSAVSTASPISLIPVPVPPNDLPAPGHEGAASEASEASGPPMASLTTISEEVGKALEPWVASDQVVIRKTQLWLEIEIRTDALFPSGVARLADAARTVLIDVAGVLGEFGNPIRIEGHTDNRPIDTWQFPSNWELSSARASSVARLFGEHGVDSRRIGVFGWGEYQPVDSNTTPEGRNRNRRIAIVVLSDQASSREEFYLGNGVTSPPANAPSPTPPTSDVPSPPMQTQ